jgi:hypothetical protein
MDSLFYSFLDYPKSKQYIEEMVHRYFDEKNKTQNSVSDINAGKGEFKL